MANSILYSEINLVCILILLLLSIKVKKSMFLQEQRHLFYLVMVSNILFLLLDAVWIFINNNVFAITIYVNWLLNSCYYILSGILGLLWFMYSETVQESKLVREKRYQLISLIPITVLVILTLISLKTGWLFYIDSDNIYHRGPAYIIQLVSSYGYVIFTAIKALYLSFHTEDYQRKKDLRTLFTFVIPTLIAGSLQVISSVFPILCIGNTFGILYVYVTLQEQLVSVDPLTKLNNRNQLFQYLSSKMAHVNENKILYLLMMDIDYFKSINDQYGHVEGDKALKTVAGCLIKACSNKHYFISRYGGDEFIIICELDQGDSVALLCDSIHNHLENVNTPYKLSLSIGYASYTDTFKNQQDFIAKADAELYKVKKQRKGNSNNR